MSALHPSLLQVLNSRGYKTAEHIDQFLNPSLDLPSFTVPQMEKAVARLRAAIRAEEPIAIYADRDVDGLAGLAILVRSLRTLGGDVKWGSPLEGRGLERAVLESLVKTGAKIIILVDCGTGEDEQIAWLVAQGMDVIIADHHRVQANLPDAFAWIHPGMADGDHTETPCGTVMAFKLAEALWRSFIGNSDPARLEYFLFDHLDLVALGILADRMPLTGRNRTLVWHGLRRLAKTRKEGLASLLRFFRLTGDTVTVRQATWQIIPLLNAAGRLGQPHWTSNLLITEDSWTARSCIDALLGLNTERRKAQGVSVEHFEKSVLEQCVIDSDAILIATARDLEPSVTGLAATALVTKYGRAAFLFVEQGEDLVGSGRGTPDVDLFLWVEKHQDLLLKFGGHQAAVGLTVRKRDFPALREGLLKSATAHAETRLPGARVKKVTAEAELSFHEANTTWWQDLQRLEPFGQGFEMPAFQLHGIDAIDFRNKRTTTKVMLKSGTLQWPGEMDCASPESGDGKRTVIASPVATPKDDFPYKWVIHER